MSQHVIKVPDVGEGVAEVELVAWTVEIGQRVVRNQVLAEVMTDKANVEIPAPVDGVIAGLNGDIGEVVAVGTDLIHIAIGGGATAPAPSPSPEPAPAAEPPPATTPTSTSPEAAPPTAPTGGVNPFAPAPAEESGAEPAPVVDAPAAAASVEPVAAAEESPTSGRAEGGVASPVPGADPTTTAGSSPATPPPPVEQREDGVELVSLPPVGADPSDDEGGRSPGGEAWPTAAAATNGSSNGQVRATPAVRARARRLGIDLSTVMGTGPQHRVTHDDLDDLLLGAGPGGPPDDIVAASGIASPVPGRAPTSRPPAPDVASVSPSAGTTEVRPLVGLRRQIAQRMVAATTTIPHITYVDEVDVTAVEDLRATLNADAPDRPKLTLLPFLIKAIVSAVDRYPGLNAHVDDEAGSHIVFDTVDVGIATQTDRGLLVPVVRDAGSRSLWDLAAEVSRLAAAARDRSIEATALSGSTITISSLGALGGLVTTPVLNKPEVSIVGVNKIDTRPVWDGTGFTPRRLMNLSSSFDHRVVDGYDAAAFIGEVRRRLEQPALLFGADNPSDA